MDELSYLATRFTEISSAAIGDFKKMLTAQKVMSKQLAEVRAWHDSPTERVNDWSIAAAVTEFRISKQLSTYLSLKYVCFGAIGVLDEPQLLEYLFSQIRKCETRRQLKCFQGLLRSYWVYPLFNDETIKRSKEGWLKLRAYLYEQLKILKSGVERKPAWFAVLLDHGNLLGLDPCGRYGQSLLNGDSSEWQAVKKGLAIPSDSWVSEEVVLAPMRTAAEFDDSGFKEKLEQIFLVFGPEASNGGVSNNLAIRCVALLVSRYARCESKPEHPVLQNAALSILGNPWIKPLSWAAHVRLDDGRPDEEARQMVAGWLKRRLLKDFFEMLSDDGVTDQRRLNYWLRFENAIDDVWIALGPRASSHYDQQFQEFRRLANGRWLHLDGGGSPNNNAFIMRIGKCIAVEFGVTGNACYVYPADPKPFTLVSGGRIEQFKLRNREIGKSFIHHKHGWERKFDSELCAKFEFWPAGHRLGRSKSTSSNSGYASSTTHRYERSSNLGLTQSEPQFPYVTAKPLVKGQISRVLCSDGNCIGVIGVDGKCKLCGKPSEFTKDFEYFLSRESLQFVDLREKGGCLWVLTSLVNTRVNEQLLAWGFKFRADKGWWRE